MPYNSQWTGQQIDDAIGKVRDNTVNASAVNVSFTPGDSGLGSTNVQDALEELAGRPSGGGSPRTYRVVVGTSTAGWTADDCDYLCNGSTDQTTISQAIAALPEEGGVVYFLDGAYKVGGYLGISKDNVTLLGNHQASILSNTGSLTMLNVSGDNVTIKGLVIQDPRQSGNATVKVSGSNFCIYDCKCISSGVLCLDISGQNALLLGTDFPNAQIMADVGTHNGARVQRCSQTGTSESSIPWLKVSGNEIDIIDNYVCNVGTGINIYNCQNVNSLGNYIDTCNIGILASGQNTSLNILNNMILEFEQYGIYTAGMQGQYINTSGNYVGMKDATTTPNGTPMAIAGERNVITSNITPQKEITTMGSRVLIDNNSY